MNGMTASSLIWMPRDRSSPNRLNTSLRGRCASLAGRPSARRDRAHGTSPIRPTRSADRGAAPRLERAWPPARASGAYDPGRSVTAVPVCLGCGQ
jgi:hypothetical protein